MTASHRRDFLKTLLGGAAGISLSSAALAQDAATPITATKITDNFTVISGAGSNVVVASNAEGLLLVNGGTPQFSAEVIKLATDQGSAKRIQALFNTDWHLENTGSNDALGKAGTRIFAHENTRLWMNTEIVVQ